MNSKPLPKPASGIIPPMLTPLQDRDTLDVGGLEKLIEHILQGGVHGLFILGTTGEGTSLGYRLRRELIERTVQQVNNRVPVLVGISDTAFVESVNLARYADECGATAVVLAPPYYMPEGQSELREYLEHLLLELPLPLFLYNIPPLTKVAFDLETVRWAMDQPGIAGIKDSSGDLRFFNRLCGLLRHRPDWSVLIGPEELLAQSMFLGGHGGVPGGANIYPRLYVRLFEAMRDDDVSRAREIQTRVLQVVERLYRVGRHPSAVIKGIKCAAACLGLCSDVMAEPFHKFRETERKRIETAVRELESVVAVSS